MGKLLDKFFYVFIPIMLGLTLTFTVYTVGQNQKLSEQIIKQNDRLEVIANQQKKSLEITQGDIADLKNTMLCIGLFFNRTDRTNLQITDYNPCVIVNTETGEETVVSFANLQTGEETTSTSQAEDGNGRSVGTDMPLSSSNNNARTPPMQSDNSQNPSDNAQPLLLRAINATMNLIRNLL